MRLVSSTRRLRTPIWAGAVLLVVAACSSSTDQSTPASPPEASPSPTATAAAGSGCSSDVNTAAAAGVTETKTVTANGKSRNFLVHLPKSYTGAEPLPLVLNFHGLGSNGGQQLLLTGLSSLADREGFIAVAPNAVNGSWDLPTTNNPTATTETSYLEAMTKYLKSNYCVDSQRVYSMGLSQGSAMTFLLACAPKSTVAAFGGVGATFYRSQCGRSDPAPIIYFHGTKDKVVPINGGKTPSQPVGPAMTAIEDWAGHNKCARNPAEKVDSDITTFTWSNCAGDADVIYHRITGGGHTWPGTDPTIAGFMESSLGKTTQTISATESIWEFFEQHTLAQRTS